MPQFTPSCCNRLALCTMMRKTSKKSQRYRVSVGPAVAHSGRLDAYCSRLQTGRMNAVLNGTNRPTLSAGGAGNAGANEITLLVGTENWPGGLLVGQAGPSYQIVPQCLAAQT